MLRAILECSGRKSEKYVSIYLTVGSTVTVRAWDGVRMYLPCGVFSGG